MFLRNCFLVLQSSAHGKHFRSPVPSILKQDMPLSLDSTASQVTLASEGWRRQWSHSGQLNFLRGPLLVGAWNAMSAPSWVTGVRNGAALWEVMAFSRLPSRAVGGGCWADMLRIATTTHKHTHKIILGAGHGHTGWYCALEGTSGHVTCIVTWKECGEGRAHGWSDHSIFLSSKDVGRVALWEERPPCGVYWSSGACYQCSHFSHPC